MYIVWRERQSERTHGRALCAELTRSERQGGRVRRVTVKHLGSIETSFTQPDDGLARLLRGEFRVRFWIRAVGALVEALGLPRPDGEQPLPSETVAALTPFVDALAARVPLPAPDEMAWFAQQGLWWRAAGKRVIADSLRTRGQVGWNTLIQLPAYRDQTDAAATPAL